MTSQRKVVDVFIPWDIIQPFGALVSGEHKNEFSGIFYHPKQRVQSRKRGHRIVESHVGTGRCNNNRGCGGNAGARVMRASIHGGHGDSAQYYEDVPFTYHTHPKYYYEEYHVNIAPPSGEDIGVFLRGAIEDNSIVHVVFSMEGIYVMIANPCFVEQARNMYQRGKKDKRARAAYNIALVGAEILGMETHEHRSTWSVDEWLAWIRGRFVCRNIDVEEYTDDIKQKFDYHCEDCDPLEINRFQDLFKEIVRTSFELAQCSEINAAQHTRWTEGNWVDVQFVTWENAQRDGGVRIDKVVYV